MLVEGPAGIGKSRLLGELTGRAGPLGVRTLAARGAHLERDFAFGVVRQLFEPVLADEGARERLLAGAAASAAPVFEGRRAAGRGSGRRLVRGAPRSLLAGRQPRRGRAAAACRRRSPLVRRAVAAVPRVCRPSARRPGDRARARWSQVVPALSELGLAALHGSSPDVGIAGYSLGGGMGWLARKHGLQTNSVTAFEVVTADGHLVRTDADHEPDLFWALRGGGGNFGVVTAIEFEVYPYAELYAGALFFPFASTREVLHAWRELLPTLPEELMTWVQVLHFPPDPAVPEPLRGASFTIVLGVHLGSEDEGRRLLAPIRALDPLMDTFAMVPPAELGDLAMDPREPLPFLSGHDLLDDVSAAAIDALVDAVGPGSDAAITLVQLRHLGGALARRAPGAGARATLPGELSLFSLGVAPDAEAARAVGDTLSAIKQAAAPYRVGDYPNFVEDPADTSSFFDAQTWRSLREVKALYDPSDLFKANHPIPPSAELG